LGSLISAGVFWSMFTTPFGIAVYAAVLLIAAGIVSLGLAAGSIALYALRKPERDTIGSQMQELEKAYREGRCRTEPGLPPCPKDPYAPPVLPGTFVPQVRSEDPLPSLVIARF
jgi:hypothetical protein